MPLTRDEILSRIDRGELTPDEAEGWAVNNNQPSFTARPDDLTYDPMAISEWTLAMALAWIIWRDAGRVREFSDEFRLNWPIWEKVVGIDANNHECISCRLSRHQPASVGDVWVEASSATCDTKRHADELWEKLKEGMLQASGLPYVGRRHAQPLRQQPGRQRVAIPREGWIDFTYANVHLPADCIARAAADEPEYEWVRVWRDQVVEIWPGASALARTGLPGRPSSSKDLIGKDFESLARAGLLPPTLAETAALLLTRLKAEYPAYPRPTLETLQNNIRAAYRLATGQPYKVKP